MLVLAEKKNTFRIAGVIIGFWIFSVPAAESIYKWVDEDGNVSYSDQPPRQVAKSEELSMDTTVSDVVVRDAQEKRERLKAKQHASHEQRTEAREQKRRQLELEQKERDGRQRRCTKAREEIQSLNHHMPVYYVDELGNRVFLDDKKRADLIEFYHREIEMFCE